MTRVETQPVDVRISDVRRQTSEADQARYYMVVLEEIEGPRRLPIWVGQYEGTAIAIQLEKVQVPRPLSFVFMADLLRAVGGKLREVRVSKLVDGTFYAIAAIEGPDGVKTVDARPSDALALALVAGAPIRVEPTVFGAAEAHMAAHRHPPLPAEEYYGVGTQGAAEIVAEVKAKWPGYGSQSGKR